MSIMEEKKKLLDYWTSIGMVKISDVNNREHFGVVYDLIKNFVVIVSPLSAIRTWIDTDSIVSIVELGNEVILQAQEGMKQHDTKG
jgi:hypothetical protein